MKRILTVLMVSVMVLAMAGAAWATNGYQLIGIGAHQKGMGGAVTAFPMDSMTAITNPAGMGRVGTRADFSMEAFWPERSENFASFGGASTTGGAELYGIPAIGWTAPAFGREDVYFGGGMYGTSGLGVDYGEVVMAPGHTFDGYTNIQFWKMAPTIAWNVNEKLSLGIALNADYQSVTIRQRVTGPLVSGFPGGEINLDLGRPTSQFGFGATIGAIYDVNEWVTVGAMYSTKQYFQDAQFSVGTGDIAGWAGAPGTIAGLYNLDLDFPMQAAIGVAIKPHHRITISVDGKWINWSNTHDMVELQGPPGAFPGDGPNASTTLLPFGWKDQWVIAVGAQVEINEALHLHFGYNYAKSPVGPEDVFANLVFPAVVEHHASAGFEYHFGEHWGISGAYMHAFKNKVTGVGDVPAGLVGTFGPSTGFDITLEEDSLGVQLTYRF